MKRIPRVVVSHQILRQAPALLAVGMIRELDVTDLNREYLRRQQLDVALRGRGPLGLPRRIWAHKRLHGLLAGGSSMQASSNDKPYAVEM